MNREVLETYLGKSVRIKLFDGDIIYGYLRKSHDEAFKNDLNLYIPMNRYFVTKTEVSKDTISCLFRASHVKKISYYSIGA